MGGAGVGSDVDLSFLAGLALLAAGSHVLAALVVEALIRRPIRRDAGDGVRKLQSVPVPTSGGVAFAFPVLALMVYAAHGHGAVGMALALPGFAMILGLVDDVFGLGPRLKTLLLAAASVAAAWGFGQVSGPVETPFGAWFDGSFAQVAGSAFFLFVLMNAFNFMDGANGLVGGVALMLAAALAIAGVMGADAAPWIAALGPPVALMGGLLAFLRRNAAGRIYMGDAGSLFLGAWFGQAALDVSRGEPGQGGAWLAALALLPLLADVFLTLGWRTLRGRPLLMAHRDHAYQRLIDLSGWSHSRVAMVYAGLTAACLAVAWGAQAVAPGAGPFAAFWIAAFMMAVLWWRVPRRPQKVS